MSQTKTCTTGLASAPAVTSHEPIDVEAMVTDWAHSMFTLTRSKEQSKIPEDALNYRINWKRARFCHSEPDYSLDSRRLSANVPRVSTLFKTNFNNETNHEQEYSFRTDRSTRSTCEVQIERGFTLGQEMSMTLKVPGDVLEANAGFHRELTLTNSSGQTFEEELSWGVDSQVRVPPRTRTSAQLVVREEAHEGTFSVRSEISGRVLVTVCDARDNNAFVKTIEGSLVEIVRREAEKAGAARMRDRGVTLERDRMVIETRGRCRFNFAVEQHVHLQEQPIENK